MPRGITAISMNRPNKGGRDIKGLYHVKLNGCVVFVGGSKEIAKEYGINQKSVSHYVKHGGKMKRKYSVVRVD